MRRAWADRPQLPAESTAVVAPTRLGRGKGEGKGVEGAQQGGGTPILLEIY